MVRALAKRDSMLRYIYILDMKPKYLDLGGQKMGIK